MKRIKLITYLVFFTFHLGLLLVAFWIDSIAPKDPIDFNKNIYDLINDLMDDLPQLIPLLKYINYIFIVKWIAIVGVALVIINFTINVFETNHYKSQINSLQNEINATKAKMFDIQKTSGDSVPPAKEEGSETTETNAENE